MTPLKQAIEQKGFKQRWIADQLDVSEESVSRWVNGETPKLHYAYRLSQLLGFSMEELFGLKSGKESPNESAS